MFAHTLLVQKLYEDAIAPQYQHPDDSGMDLHAYADLCINPGDRALVKTGIAIAVPRGHEAQVRPRSGLALKHGVTVLNTPGTIDRNYRGEIGVILINHGSEYFHVKKGDRIAQLVICPVDKVLVELVDGLPPTIRGTDGFGSTGV